MDNNVSAPTNVNNLPPVSSETPPKKNILRNNLFLIVGIFIFTLFIGTGGYYLGKKSNSNNIANPPSPTPAIDQKKACTQEAKICPDGSSVGRTGPNCEFPPCPTINSTTATPGIFSVPKVESYVSCGCGCCGSDKPLEEIATVECLYKSKGESIQDKINKDKQLSPDLCATVGCSTPIKYVYCD